MKQPPPHRPPLQAAAASLCRAALACGLPPASAQTQARPQVVFAVGNSQSMDGNMAGAVQSGESLETRSNIGRDLHDDLGSHLTGVELLSKVLQQKIAKDDPEKAEQLGIHVIDAGHFGTEMPIVRVLAEELAACAEQGRWNIAVEADAVSRDLFQTV